MITLLIPTIYLLGPSCSRGCSRRQRSATRIRLSREDVFVYFNYNEIIRIMYELILNITDTLKRDMEEYLINK